jgi:hypothetical protein
MKKDQNSAGLEKKLDRVIYLLEYLVALELHETKLNRSKIRSRTGIQNKQLTDMLKDIKKDD